MNDLDLDISQQKEVLEWIHSLIGSRFGKPELDPPEFLESMPRCGVFVTLHLKGQLRGCIGYIQSDRELIHTIRDAAGAAAFKDYRFLPLEEEEWEKTEVELSLLSPMEEISGPEDLIMGEHGALLEAPRGRGLFLPQVATEQNWDRATFMDHLCMKAGLPREYWKTGSYTLHRFSARVF